MRLSHAFFPCTRSTFPRAIGASVDGFPACDRCAPLSIAPFSVPPSKVFLTSSSRDPACMRARGPCFLGLENIRGPLEFNDDANTMLCRFFFRCQRQTAIQQYFEDDFSFGTFRLSGTSRPSYSFLSVSKTSPREPGTPPDLNRHVDSHTACFLVRDLQAHGLFPFFGYCQTEQLTCGYDDDHCRSPADHLDTVQVCV